MKKIITINMLETYNKMIDEYEMLAKKLMIYNTFSGGLLQQNLTDEKMEENVLETYKNIINYGFKSDDHSDLIEKCSIYLKKIIKLFNEMDMSEEIDRIVGRHSKNFYGFFCFLSESIYFLARTGNLLYKFIIFITEVDFDSLVKNDLIFLESCLLVQRLLKLGRNVIFLQWRRIGLNRL